MKNVRTFKPAVLKTLQGDALSRSTDIRLIRIVLEELNLPTDLKLLEEEVTDGTNILESIRRCRQKVMEENPTLRVDRTKLKRAAKEKEFKEFARG